MQAEYSWLARWLLPTVSKLNVLKVPVAPVKYCRQPAGALQGRNSSSQIHLLNSITRPQSHLLDDVQEICETLISHSLSEKDSPRNSKFRVAVASASRPRSRYTGNTNALFAREWYHNIDGQIMNDFKVDKITDYNRDECLA